MLKGISPARFISTCTPISLNDTSEKPLKAFMWTIAYLFQQRGLDPTKTIVWYEDITGTRAARGLWFCEYLGHEAVRVVDGGLNAWIAAGGELSTEAEEPPEVPAVSDCRATGTPHERGHHPRTARCERFRRTRYTYR